MLFIGLSGCATSSIFLPYPEQAELVRQSLASQPPQLLSTSPGPNLLLHELENGRVQQLASEYAASQISFDAASRQYQERDTEAVLDISNGATQAASLAVNDNLLTYPEYGYERVLLHLYQAFNYLGQNNLVATQVELRKAAEHQQYLQDNFSERSANQIDKAKKFHIDLSQLDSALPQLSQQQVQVNNSYQNAFVYYASAIIWEALGNTNDALVDYRKASTLVPDNAWLAADLHRLEQGQQVADEEHGRLVVIYEDGLVEPRSDLSLDIWLYPDKILPISFPWYAGYQKWNSSSLQVSTERESLGQTQVIANIQGLAVQALKEAYPGILIREILRGRAKYELLNNTVDNDNILVFIAAQVYTLATSGPDLRSWLTLPDNVQILSRQLPVGKQKIRLNSGAISREVELDIAPGETRILRVLRVNYLLDYQEFTINRQ
ncbi:hypothetical protein DC094_01535 [Pelagibaculum spongiae]|uniref:Uncharacterized protein n=2 Tax=Pelagibaculum spongiae TaxID=2080658 RepID=A0A2V1H4N7_9GAMM|nr:hypothetical protein DC094_01535 [Pelagibaculum spongiae]